MTIDRETRKNKVLAAVVKLHIETAEPIGSLNVAKILRLSSATIRNAMNELEKEGYLQQPHTSAGRVPTDRGYRKYVDNIISFAQLPAEDLLATMREYMAKRHLFEDIMQSVSRAISKITRYAGMALSPQKKLYFDGTYHLLEQPEFREINIAREFLRAIEEKEEFLDIINRDLGNEGPSIHIGRENTFKELKECAIVTSNYKFRNNLSGSVGVIGPMRMRYEEIVPIVEHFASITTELLEEISYDG